MLFDRQFVQNFDFFIFSILQKRHASDADAINERNEADKVFRYLQIPDAALALLLGSVCVVSCFRRCCAMG